MQAPKLCPLCRHPRSCHLSANRVLTDSYECPRCGRYMLVDHRSFLSKYEQELFRLACIANEWRIRAGAEPAGQFLLVSSALQPRPEPKTPGERIVTADEMLELFPKGMELFDRALRNVSQLVQHPSERVEMPWEDWSYVLFSPKNDIMQHVKSMVELGFLCERGSTRSSGVFSVGTQGWNRLKELEQEGSPSPSSTSDPGGLESKPPAASKTDEPESERMRPDPSTGKVFVVHGRDDALRSEVCRLLERLDLQPVVLSEQTDQGRTVIEKFEQHSKVAYAVVLLTPDDEGRLRASGELQPRARQNVVFELA